MIGWITSLIVHGVDVEGRTTPVVVGLVRAQSGEVHLATRIGEEGDPVFLPPAAAAQLIVNLRAAVGDYYMHDHE